MKIALSLLTVLSVALLAQGSALSGEYEWAAFKVNYIYYYSYIIYYEYLKYITCVKFISIHN